MGDANLVRRLSAPWAYGLAAFATAVGVLLRLALDPLLGTAAPMLLLTLAAFVTAVFGGFLPTLVCVVLSCMAGMELFLSPRGELFPSEPHDWVRLALFIVIGVAAGVLGEMNLRTLERERRQRTIISQQSSHLERLLRTLEKAPVMVWDSATGKLTHWSDGSEQLYGYSAAETIGRPIQDVLRTQTPEPRERILERLRSQKEWVGELTHTRKDGSSAASLSTWILHEDSDGRQLVVEVHSDLTEQKRVEAVLNNERDFTEKVLSTVASLVCVVDRDGRIVRFNVACERASGYSASEVLGKTVFETVIPPDEAPGIRSILAEFGTAHSPLKHENDWIRKDGERRRIAWLNSSIADAEGNVHFIIAAGTDVTEQRRAQRELADSERRFRGTFENAAVGISHLDADGRWIDVNRTFCEMLGYTREELMALDIYTITHPDDREAERRQYARLMSGEIPSYVAEKRYLRKDGSSVWASVTRALQPGEPGEAPYSINVIVDLTDRRAAEESTRKSEAFLRKVLGSSLNGIYIFDLQQQRTTFINAQYTKLTGWAMEDLEHLWGTELMQLFHPDDWPRLLQHQQEMLAAGDEASEIEYRLRTKTGEWRWVLARETIFARDEHDKPTQTIGTFVDITHRKQAEAAVRASERRFRLLADAMPQIVWVTAADGSHEYFNQRWYDYTAMSPSASKGDGWSTALHPDDLQRTRDRWAHSIKTGEPYQIEYRFRRHDGAYKWFLARALPVQGEDGRITSWFGTCTEIDEYKRLQREREQLLADTQAARSEAERANHAKDHFLAVLSHELRTPLTPALAAAGAMETDPRIPEDLREEAQMVRRNIELEKRIIDDLLDLTRVIHGKLQMETAAVNLSSVIRRAVAICSIEADAKDVRLNVDIKSDLVVRGDAARLQQVIWNLLNNAIKFTPPRGQVWVKCCVIREHDISVQISDTGIGIDAPSLERVFDAFEQLDRRVTRDFGGLGLGLAICRAIVEAHGGSIRAQSEGAGRGATFTVTLPRLVTEEDARPEPREDDRTLSTDRPCLKILLVEDHQDTARILSQILRRYGHEVTTAGDVQTARETADKGKFDLLISDLGLPDGSGLDVIRHIRQTSAMPAIALSGYGMDEDVRRSTEAGFAEHITKPVNINQLREAVQRVGHAAG